MADALPQWTWTGNELRNSTGQLIAAVRSDVIDVGEERLLVESTPGPMHFRARATTSSGKVFTASQRGLTISKLIATCDTTSYILERTSVWRKEREIRGAHGVLAVVRPMISGNVVMTGTELAGELPNLHAVFLSWACVLVDSPVRRPRY